MVIFLVSHLQSRPSQRTSVSGQHTLGDADEDAGCQGILLGYTVSCHVVSLDYCVSGFRNGFDWPLIAGRQLLALSRLSINLFYHTDVPSSTRAVLLW